MMKGLRMKQPKNCQVCNRKFEESEKIHIKHEYYMCKECTNYLNIMKDEVKKKIENNRRKQYGKHKYHFYDYKSQEIIDLILGNEFDRFEWR